MSEWLSPLFFSHSLFNNLSERKNNIFLFSRVLYTPNSTPLFLPWPLGNNQNRIIPINLNFSFFPFILFPQSDHQSPPLFIYLIPLILAHTNRRTQYQWKARWTKKHAVERYNSRDAMVGKERSVIGGVSITAFDHSYSGQGYSKILYEFWSKRRLSCLSNTSDRRIPPCASHMKRNLIKIQTYEQFPHKQITIGETWTNSPI